MKKLIRLKYLLVFLMLGGSLFGFSQQQPWNNIDYEWHNINTAGTVRFVRSDSFGNSWFIGSFTGSVNFNPGGSDIKTSNGGTDVFLTKRDPDGNYMFTVTFGGAGNDDVHDVGMYMALNRPVLYGTFTGVVDFNPDPMVTQNRGGNGEKAYLMMLTANGALQYVRTIGDNNVNLLELGALGVDEAGGTVAITGRAVMTAGQGVLFKNNASPSMSDIFLENTTGSLLIRQFIFRCGGTGIVSWGHFAENSADPWNQSLEIKNSTIYWTGAYIRTSAGNVNFDVSSGSSAGNLFHPGGGINKLFVVKLTALGAFISANGDTQVNQFGGTNILVNGSDIYVGGSSTGSTIIAGGTTYNTPNHAVFLLKFSESTLNLVQHRVFNATQTSGWTNTSGMGMGKTDMPLYIRNELGVDYLFLAINSSSTGGGLSTGFNILKLSNNFSTIVFNVVFNRYGPYRFRGNALWHGTLSAISVPTNYDPNGSIMENTGVAHSKYSICQLGSGSSYDDFAFCEGSAATIPALDLGENWYWTDGTNDFFTTDGELIFDPIRPEHVGGYTAYAQQNECVWTPSTFSVLLQTMPEFIDVSADINELCEGEDVTLEGSYTPGITVGTTTLEWSGPDGYSDNVAISSFTTSSNSEGWYYFQVDETARTTCTIIDSVYITVNDLPEFIQSVAVNTANICEGGTIELSADGGVGVDYTWSGPNGFTSNDQNPVISNADQTNSGFYSLIITDLITGCSNMASANDSVEVLILEMPIIDLISSSDYTPCINYDTITFNVEGNFSNNSDYTVNWTKYDQWGNTTWSATGETPELYNNLTNGWYYVEVTNTLTGCSATDSLELNVIWNPMNAGDATYQFDYMPSLLKCENDTMGLVTFLVNNPPVVDFSIYPYDSTNLIFHTTGPNGYNSNEQDHYFTPLMPEDAGIYNSIVTDTVTGCINFTMFEIEVYDAPDIEIDFFGGQCIGNDLTLNSGVIDLNSTDWAQYSWSGPNGFASTDSSVVIPNVSTADAGWYYVEVMNAIGCVQYDSLELVIYSIPDIVDGINVMPDQTICEGEDLSFTLISNPDWSYSWSGPNGFTSIIENPVIPNATEINSGNYSVIVTDVNTGCSNQLGLNDNVDVVVSPLPVIPIPVSASNDNLCVGEDIELQSEFVLGVDFLWSGPNGFTSTEQNPIIPNANQTNSGNYVLVITDQTTGCSNETGLNDNVDVLVSDPAQINSVESSDGGNGVCFGEAVQVSGNTSGGTLYWSGPNGFEYEGSAFTINGFSSSNSGWYYVELTDTVNGCPNNGGAMSDSIYLNGINCDIIIPEIFSPNGDGFNDGFVIVGIENYPGTNLRIFNRWGSEIFFRDDYQNDWFGQSESKLNIGKGDILPEGVYFYLIELGGDSDEIFKGNVYLKR